MWGELISPAMANGVGVVGVIVMVGVAVMTGNLIPGKWHREALAKAEARADRWETVALNALSATERLIEPVETAAKVLTKIPTPEGTES